MQETSDNKSVAIFEALDFFESRLKAFEGESRKAYRKALSSFRWFVTGRYSRTDIITLPLLENWFFNNLFQGMSFNTAAFYLDKISALHGAMVKAGKAEESVAFRDMRKKIRTLDPKAPARPVTEAALGRFLDAVKGSYRSGIPGNPILDILLFSLINGCMPLQQIAALQKEDLKEMEGESEAIARRYAEPRRRYIFPLDQTKRTPRQTATWIDTAAEECLRALGLPWAGSAGQSVRLLWASVALRCGVDGSSVVAVLGSVPAGLSLLSICTPAELQAADREAIVRTVAAALFKDRLHWFAMHFRPYVKFSQLLTRLAEIRDAVPQPELFYPCEEIARRIGKRLVWEEKPILSDILFFRSRVSDVYPLLSRIYDLAWCFRDSRDRGSSYSIIPQRSMDAFQQAIGVFTPDFEVAPIGEMRLNPDDKVVIIGGDYPAQPGTVTGMETDPEHAGNIIYRIEFLTPLGRWNVGVDARLVRPA